MALHGSIEVNHQRIGYWSVRRIMTCPSGNHTYRWEAWRDGHHVTGDLRHRYDDGAMLLAAKVLRLAHAALEAKWPQTPATEATLTPEPLPAPPEGDSLPKAPGGATEARSARPGVGMSWAER